jgi:hypothetical protein
MPDGPELTPVEGKRTVKAFLAKVDHCEALWVKYGFLYEEIEQLKVLIDKLQTEWAFIEVDREPSYPANPSPLTGEQTKVAEPKEPTKKGGRPKAGYTQIELKMLQLLDDGMKPQAIATKLGRSVKETRSKIAALRRRREREHERERLKTVTK